MKSSASFRAARLVLALGTLATAGQAQLVATDLNSGLTPTDLVNTLLGGTITITNVSLTGSNIAAGRFSGGTGILGFDAGIVLSSGDVANVTAAGMLNNFDDVTSDNQLNGDPDLDLLIPGYQTHDATVLEFDFDCPTLNVLSFEYVFSSDEYNEYVNTSFNDVFGFFVNGVNVAVLSDGVTPVSINNVNGGNPFGVGASNPQDYINNDCDDLGGGGSFPCLPFVQTEMDGRTVVLTVFTQVLPGVNHIKLAIADAGDHILDSNVFIKAHTFNCGPPCPRPVVYCTAKTNSVGCVPEIEMTDSPSASGSTVCELETHWVIANKPGFYLHSLAGPQNLPFHGGTLCISTPLRRHTPRLAIGAGVGCDGYYEEDFNAYIASGRDPGLVEGAVVWIQTWARDPNAPYGDSLSDAIMATICP